MNTNQLQILEKTDSTDFQNVDSLLDGCNRAVVTFALNDKMKRCKVITLYSVDDFNMDEIVMGNSQIMKGQGNIFTYRSFLYNIKNKSVIKTSYNFLTVILKTIKGFTINTQKPHAN